MTDNFKKLTQLLETFPKVEPSPDYFQKIKTRVREIPKLATLGTTLGDVKIQRIGSDFWELAKSGDALFNGDKLSTGIGGKTFIIFKNETQVWLNQNTALELSPSPRHLFLSMGRRYPARAHSVSIPWTLKG